MKSRIELFVLAFILWCLIVWPYGEVYNGWDLQGLAFGLVAATIVAAIFGKGFTDEPARLFNPRRWFFALGFLFVFIFYCIKANLQVTYFVLHPHLPIRPGIIKMRTRLKSRVAITVLANCITLTPGTLTVEATEEGYLFVHWLNVRTTDENEAGRIIASKFEYFLERIFEDR